MARQKNKQILIILGLLFLFVLLGLVWFRVVSNKTVEQTSTETINYSPPTDEEKRSGDNVDLKKNTQPVNSQTDTKNTTPQQGSGSASVAITDAGVYDSQVEIRAFVSNVIADGTCNYTFTANGNTITKTSPAKADISTTNCLTLDFAKSELSSSTQWSVTVQYTSLQGGITGSTQTTLKL